MSITAGGLVAASLFSGLVSGATSAYGANKAGKDAANAVYKQLGWEYARARNAHQWEVADLKDAGLNPILSADGSGATTGGISAPMPDRSGYTEAGAAIIDAINSAYGAAKTNAEIGRTGAETANITQDTQNKLTAQELMKKQIINEALRSGIISAQKANLEFKNLTEKYNGERAALTYWNNFINTATNSAKNATGAVDQVINTMVPKKHAKEVFETMGKGWKHSRTDYF